MSNNCKKIDLYPEVIINISQTIYDNGFDYQLSERNINKLRKEYDQLIKIDDAENSEVIPIEPREERKEEDPVFTTFGHVQQKDKFLPVLNQLDPNNFQVQDISGKEEENSDEGKSIYYYPKKMEDPPSVLDGDNSEERVRDLEYDLLHNFFPSNGFSGSIEDAKNFLVSHKLVNDEKEINVMRGPFTDFEIKLQELEEEGKDTTFTPVVEYVEEKVDPEMAAIAEFMPSKPDYPNETPNQRQGANQQQEEPRRKPEDRLAYEKPSKQLPCLLTTETKKIISIDQLMSERYRTADSSEPGSPKRGRKRRRSEAEEEIKEQEDVSMEVGIVEKPNSKIQRTTEVDKNFIIITEDDSEFRKKTFKTY